MKIVIQVISLLLCFNVLCGQRVQNPAFDEELRDILDLNTSLVSVDDISSEAEKYVFLDAREPNEYAISHIPKALNIGYDRWNPSIIKDIDKEQPIVVYCSVGYRSERITKRLEKMGYQNVSNLYGSIFEWANCNLPLEDNEGNSTYKVHTYNRNWSKWVTNPLIRKQW